MSLIHVCRLCRNNCDDAISLCDASSCFTEVHEITIKFFHPSFLGLDHGTRSNLDVLCFDCWHHISSFHNFQQTVLLIQAKLLKDAELAEQSEVTILPINSSGIPTVEVAIKEEEEFVSLSEVELTNTQAKGQLMLTERALQFVATADSLQDTRVILVDDSLDGSKNISSSVNEEPIGVFVGGDLSTDAGNSNLSFSELQMIEHEFKSDNEHCVEMQDDNISVSSTASTSSEPDAKWAAKLKKQQESMQKTDGIIAQWKPILECEICKESFSTFTLLQTHFRLKHPGEVCYFVCCKRKFKYRCRIKDHIRIHLYPETFKCSICGKCFSTKWTLDTHMFYIHHNAKQDVPDEDNPLLCKIVGKPFDAPSPVNGHSCNNTAQTIHRCSECPASFKYHSSFCNHMTKFHPDKITRPKKPKKRTALQECQICEKRFTYRTGLYYHLRVQHPEEFTKRRTI